MTSMNVLTKATNVIKMQIARTQSEVMFVTAKVDTEMRLVMELCVGTRTSAGQVFELRQLIVMFRRERLASTQLALSNASA